MEKIQVVMIPAGRRGIPQAGGKSDSWKSPEYTAQRTGVIHLFHCVFHSNGEIFGDYRLYNGRNFRVFCISKAG